MIKAVVSSLVLILLSANAYSDVLCKKDESVSFSCGLKSKNISVCRNSEDALIYRFGTPKKIELELESEVHFSRTAFCGGGEGHLTFFNGNYRYVVYSSISNGRWLDDGTREKVERAGVYVAKGDKLLTDIECRTFPGKSFIHNLPAYDEQPFRYYD